MKRVKFCLDEKEMPTSWYNILADLPEPLPPPLHRQQASLSDLMTLLPYFPWL